VLYLAIVRHCNTQDVVCKSLTALYYYSTIVNTAWMFVEGLYLHQRVAVSVFRSTLRFHVYHAVGWGLFILASYPNL